MIYDSHVDTPTELLRGRNIGIDNKTGHIDFPKLRCGGVDGSFFALYTSSETPPDAATRYALEMLSATYDAVDENQDLAAITFSPSEAAENLRKGVFSVFMGMENGSPIQKSLPLLRTFYRLGVSYLTLTHNGDNEIADSALLSKGTWGGLSPFGREVIREMNSIGMMVDLSHAADATFWDCIKLSKAPVIATHSCCRSICPHGRNLTDEMLRALGENDGYVGINFYPHFLSTSLAEKGVPPTVKDVVDHIEHAIEICGIDHVGIGSDFDGIEVTPLGLENVSQIGAVFTEMNARGYSSEEISKVSGGNLMKVWEKVIKCSELAD